MFTLTPIKYSFTDLEPYIDALTVEIHYTKHHQTYVNKLNEILAGTEYLTWNLEDLLKKVDTLPENLQKPVINNAGQVYNHDMYWVSMTPNGSELGERALKDKITSKWGSMDQFKAEFSKLGLGQFGSGWVWLSVDESGELSIESTGNALSPLMSGKTPILTMDVWEHAYYLKYKNLRAEYITNFINVIDWKAVEERYQQAV